MHKWTDNKKDMRADGYRWHPEKIYKPNKDVTIQSVQFYISRNVGPNEASPLLTIAITLHNNDNAKQRTRNGSLTADNSFQINIYSLPMFVMSSYFKHSLTLECRH